MTAPEREAFARMAAAVRREIPRLEERAAFVRAAVQYAGRARSRAVRFHFAAAAALGLTVLYNAMERLWRNIAGRIDRTVPSGRRRRAELLRQMSLDLRGVRPPVLREETCGLLDELRRFRSLVWHTPITDITEERVRFAAEVMERAVPALRRDLEAFAEALERLSARD